MDCVFSRRRFDDKKVTDINSLFKVATLTNSTGQASMAFLQIAQSAIPSGVVYGLAFIFVYSDRYCLDKISNKSVITNYYRYPDNSTNSVFIIENNGYLTVVARQDRITNQVGTFGIFQFDTAVEISDAILSNCAVTRLAYASGSSITTLSTNDTTHSITIALSADKLTVWEYNNGWSKIVGTSSDAGTPSGTTLSVPVTNGVGAIIGLD